MVTVKDILDTKGHDVWSVRPDDTVYNAVKLMAEKGIGCLLALDDEKLVGVVTERDYARKVVLEGQSSRDLHVSDVMTRKVLCVSPERSTDECMALMTEKRVRHLPVVDHKQVVGIISIGDLVKAVISEQRILINQLQHYITG